MINQPNNSSTAANPVGRFMVAAGAVVELAGTGKILLLQRSAELDWHPLEWEIGYGRLDQFEDVEQGLRRELKEEVGLDGLQFGPVLRVWHIFRGPEKADNELIGITFAASTTQEKIVLSSEHAHYNWVEPEQALSLVKVEGIRTDIQKFIDYKLVA